jgi:hypothetical protein
MDASHLDNTGAPEVPKKTAETTPVRQDGTMIGGSGTEMRNLESCSIKPARQTFSQYLGRSLPINTSSIDIEASLSDSQDSVPLGYHRSAL